MMIFQILNYWKRVEMNLKEAILEASGIRGIDPYMQPFKHADSGIKASDFGSFSDHCAPNETRSGKYHPDVILRVCDRTRTGKSLRYLLL